MTTGQVVVVRTHFLRSGILLSGGGSHTSSVPPPPPAECASAAFFPCQQGWLVADGAYSVPPGNGTSVWIVADTFVGAATSTGRTQSNGFIHNFVAISTCTAQSCSYEYYWTGKNTSNQGPVFSVPGSSTDWLWPMGSFIYNGTLYLCLMQMHQR